MLSVSWRRFAFGEMLQSPEFYIKAEEESNQKLTPGGQPDKSYMSIKRDKILNTEVHKY